MDFTLTLRAPSARYLASEWRCVAPVGDETRRAATPVQSPSSTNLPPAVPCCGKFHLPRSPMSGCKTWLHEIGAEISVAMFSVYQKFVGLAILVENLVFWRTAHRIYVMEPMHISCAEVIELFGDSDSENWDDFAGFSPDDIDCLARWRSQWMSESVWLRVLPTVRTTTISPAISTWTPRVKLNQRKMQRFGLRLLVDACFGGLCARNSTQTGLVIIKFINYMQHWTWWWWLSLTLCWLVMCRRTVVSLATCAVGIDLYEISLTATFIN